MKNVAILGYGDRGRRYAMLCKNMPKDYKIVNIIDPSKEKLNLAKNDLNLSDNDLYYSLDEFLKSDTKADWMFICTQDKLHHEHTIKALNNGFNILLEKPIACSIEDCLDIEKLALEKGLRVEVCHVLRYSVYYDKIKEIIESGKLGKIISIEQVENVAYWHQAHSFVRGDWGNSDDSNPMIIAKCCHDLDMAVYLANSKCVKVNSVGRLHYFNKENAPEGATEYCLGGCKAKDNCPYDCEKIYINPIKYLPPFTYKHMWPQAKLTKDGIVTKKKLYEAMKTTDYGKCVFYSNNNVVDYQEVNMEFENGITSTLIMTAFSATSFRETRVRGAYGELICNMGDNKIYLHMYGKNKKRIRLNEVMDAHGGGDAKLIQNLAKDEVRTDITDSIESHLIGFAAEISRVNDGKSIYLDDLRKNNK